MDNLCSQVELWFTRDTTERWEQAFLLFFERDFFLDDIQGLEKGVVRVTFQGKPTHLLQYHLRVYLDIQLRADGVAFDLSHYGLGEELQGAFTRVPVSAFRNSPDQLIGALHQQATAYH